MHEPMMPTRPHSDAELETHPTMLIHEISRLFFDRMRRTDPHGVLSQHGGRLVLLALLRAEQSDPARKAISQREIADATRLKAPTISTLLREMEAEGLITRTANERDARACCVALTDAGRAANEDIRLRLTDAEKTATDGLDEEERRTLGTLLLRMRNNLLEKEVRTK